MAIWLLRTAAVLVFALVAPRAWNAEIPAEFPAWNASEAPKWDPKNPPKMPSYRWPDDFKLPRVIVIRDLPEAPEEIQGPSPPIEQQKPSAKKKKRSWLPGFLAPSGNAD